MVGPRLRQPAREARIGMPSACKADHPHACGAPGLNTVHTVFDDETALRRGREPLCCMEKEVRRGFAVFDEVGRIDMIAESRGEARHGELAVELFRLG